LFFFQQDIDFLVKHYQLQKQSQCTRDKKNEKCREAGRTTAAKDENQSVQAAKNWRGNIVMANGLIHI
jgi:hypothetical protein